MTEAGQGRPSLRRFLAGGALSGAIGALVNSLYFALFTAQVAYAGAEPTLGSVVVASFFPPVLAGLGYGVLARLTERATPIFVLVTWAITLATFQSVFDVTLPDGTPKPAGFDALVMPMHVVVGGFASLILPLFTRTRATPEGG